MELAETPFFPQTELHCGPAALATVLAQSGIDVTPDDLAEALFIPTREGSLREELLATARQQNRIPVLLEPAPQALVDTVAAGKPVLILQNLGAPGSPVWHYAVLIGYRPDSGRFLLRSGTRRRLEMSPRRFLHAWDWGGRWAMVLLSPGESLATVTSENYLAALGDIEQTADREFALAAFRGASRIYPESPVSWAGLGHAAWRNNDLTTARMAFERMLEIDPSSVAAHNNLANVHLAAHCPDSARHHAGRARELLGKDGRFAAAVASTLESVESETGAGTDACLFSGEAARRSGAE